MLALALAVAISLAWALPAASAGGKAYADAILWSQTTERVASDVAHPRPVWWYLLGLPVSLLPLAFWPGLWRTLGAARRRLEDSGTRFCLLWLGSGFLLLSAVSSKQPHYLLPIFPPVALLLIIDHSGSMVETRTDRASKLAMAKEAIQAFGRIDILVNNAGVSQLSYTATQDLPKLEWDTILGINLTGTFLCCKHVGRGMIAGGGSIINIATTAGITGVARAPAYAASKAGVILLTKSLALE